MIGLSVRRFESHQYWTPNAAALSVGPSVLARTISQNEATMVTFNHWYEWNHIRARLPGMRNPSTCDDITRFLVNYKVILRSFRRYYLHRTGTKSPILCTEGRVAHSWGRVVPAWRTDRRILIKLKPEISSTLHQWQVLLFCLLTVVHSDMACHFISCKFYMYVCWTARQFIKPHQVWYWSEIEIQDSETFAAVPSWIGVLELYTHRGRRCCCMAWQSIQKLEELRIAIKTVCTFKANRLTSRTLKFEPCTNRFYFHLFQEVL